MNAWSQLFVRKMFSEKCIFANFCFYLARFIIIFWFTRWWWWAHGREWKWRRERWKRGIRSATSFKCQLWMEKFIRILMLWIMHISGKIKCLKGITQNLKCIKSISFSIIYGEEFTWAETQIIRNLFLNFMNEKNFFQVEHFFCVS